MTSLVALGRNLLNRRKNWSHITHLQIPVGYTDIQ